ncbi:MAG: hypothetical protein NZ700_07470 [Gemmataceae bacterium]|nr:hypothetical protein [Gemmataceae bacterium]
MTIHVRACSIDRMNSGRARQALASPHGTRAKPNTAVSVPTAFAWSEYQTLIGRPCTRPSINRAKLVVMPHDGHGRPANARKEHGGSPSCWCVPSRSG